jgi:hypothetical protein
MGLGQDEEAAIVDHQAQTPIPLGPGPSNPLVPVLQMLGGGTEKQKRQPVALGVHSRVTHLLAHSFETAKIVVLTQQSLTLSSLLRVGEHDHSDLF